MPLDSTVIQLHIYIFSIFFSVRIYHRVLNTVPCTVQFIHLVCNSLHLLIPDSQSHSPEPPSPSATVSLLSLLLLKRSCMDQIVFHGQNIVKKQALLSGVVYNQ